METGATTEPDQAKGPPTPATHHVKGIFMDVVER